MRLPQSKVMAASTPRSRSQGPIRLALPCPALLFVHLNSIISRIQTAMLSGKSTSLAASLGIRSHDKSRAMMAMTAGVTFVHHLKVDKHSKVGRSP